ncbi:hypothetical protein J6590_034637 [Homalodisca vitripennis]|nr:hypothetical protein J6590_034637 [Homalodisca vitripennis]
MSNALDSGGSIAVTDGETASPRHSHNAGPSVVHFMCHCLPAVSAWVSHSPVPSQRGLTSECQRRCGRRCDLLSVMVSSFLFPLVF